MNIQRVYQHYQSCGDVLCCPLCRSPLRFQPPASALCGGVHCFDLSAKGYLNLWPHQKPTRYQKELFESRRIVFDHGFYRPLADRVLALLRDRFGPNGAPTLLDAGCGEGYYSGYVQRVLSRCRIFALDNCKDAVIMGAKAHPQARWLVGNLANLPFHTASVDGILELFAPSNYEEFSRILKEDGVVIKVIPGDDYLKELREELDFSAAQRPYTSRRVADYFSEKLTLIHRQRLTYRRPVAPQLREHFVKMSPVAFGREAAGAQVQFHTLTFDFELLVGQKTGK